MSPYKSVSYFYPTSTNAATFKMPKGGYTFDIIEPKRTAKTHNLHPDQACYVTRAVSAHATEEEAVAAARQSELPWMPSTLKYHPEYGDGERPGFRNTHEVIDPSEPGSESYHQGSEAECHERARELNKERARLGAQFQVREIGAPEPTALQKLIAEMEAKRRITRSFPAQMALHEQIKTLIAAQSEIDTLRAALSAK